jgi:hypothetical protein
MIYTFIIATKDEEDLASGHKRKKAGDIIAICPAGHHGGKITRKTHLLLEIECGDISWEDIQRLTIPDWEDGTNWYLDPDLPQPKIAGKRRYKIPLTDLDTKSKEKGKTIDFQKLLDQDLDYQPLKDVSFDVADLVLDKRSDKKTSVDKIKAIINEVTIKV